LVDAVADVFRGSLDARRVHAISRAINHWRRPWLRTILDRF